MQCMSLVTGETDLYWIFGDVEWIRIVALHKSCAICISSRLVVVARAGCWRCRSEPHLHIILTVLLKLPSHWSDVAIIKKICNDDDDCFYIALFSALEQTHCARMWFYMSDLLFITRFWISTDDITDKSCARNSQWKTTTVWFRANYFL